jgi:hypothetical protein
VIDPNETPNPDCLAKPTREKSLQNTISATRFPSSITPPSNPLPYFKQLSCFHLYYSVLIVHDLGWTNKRAEFF